MLEMQTKSYNEKLYFSEIIIHLTPQKPATEALAFDQAGIHGRSVIKFER